MYQIIETMQTIRIYRATISWADWSATREQEDAILVTVDNNAEVLFSLETELEYCPTLVTFEQLTITTEFQSGNVEEALELINVTRGKWAS